MAAKNDDDEDTLHVSDEDEEQEEEEQEEELDEDGNPKPKDEEVDLDDDTLRDLAKDDDDTPVIPKARFDEVVDERNRLLDHALKGAAAAAKKDEPPPFDLKAKIKERNTKLMEGDEDAALAIDLEVEEYRTGQAAERAAQRYRAERVQEDVAEASGTVESKFPQLKPGSKKYDQDVVDEVVALRNVYIQRGMPVGKAIIKASERICARGQAAADDDDRGDPKNVTRMQPRMTAAQIAEKMALQKRQPPRTGEQGVGNRERSGERVKDIDFENMSDAEFERMQREQPEVVKEAM